MYVYALEDIFSFFLIMVRLWWIYYYIQGKVRVKYAESLLLVP